MLCTGDALVETRRLNASWRAFRPLSTLYVRKAQRASVTRIALGEANQGTPGAFITNIAKTSSKFKDSLGAFPANLLKFLSFLYKLRVDLHRNLMPFQIYTRMT